MTTADATSPSRAVRTLGTADSLEHELITEPQRVRVLLTALAAQRAVGVARGAGDLMTPGVPLRLEPPGMLLMDWRCNPPTPPLWVEVTGYCSAYRFLLRDRESFPHGISEISRMRSRKQRRAPAPPRAFVFVEEEKARTQHVLRDVSVDGLSFHMPGAPHRYHRGQQLMLTVEWKGGQSIRLAGEVRRVSPSPDGHGFCCGVRISHLPPSEDSAWMRELEELLYPGTRTRDLNAEHLWDLYDNSGYFRLSAKSEAHFAGLKAAFVKTTRTLETAPALGVRVARVTERGVEGTVSQLKVFSGTWLVYQLARMEKGRPLWSAGSDVLRELHVRGYEHAARDPDLRWLLSYVQDSARFSKLLQYDVPAQYVESGRSCVVPFHALEAQFTAADVPAIHGDVHAPTQEETQRLLSVIRGTRPRPWCEAYDYVPERFSLRRLQQQWAQAGMVRQRRVMIVRRGAVTTAAAVMDLAEDGLHLFGLLDAVRLFAMQPGGEADFGLLLRQARRFYADAGKYRYVYFKESDDEKHLADLTFADMGRASTTVLPVELLPELMERLHEVTAPTSPADDGRQA